MGPVQKAGTTGLVVGGLLGFVLGLVFDGVKVVIT